MVGEPQPRYQLIAVVDPGVGSEYEITGLAHEREFFLEGFRRRPEHSMPQTDGPFVPDPCAIRTPVGKDYHHPFHIRTVNRTTVKIVYSYNSTHNLAFLKSTGTIAKSM